VRATNCLKSANIALVGELVQRLENDMLRTKNFGKKSLDEIKRMLAEMGLDFGMKIENFEKKYKDWKRKQQNEA
jgi:DNA-directed RNA polymerase subunit alpha